MSIVSFYFDSSPINWFITAVQILLPLVISSIALYISYRTFLRNEPNLEVELSFFDMFNPQNLDRSIRTLGIRVTNHSLNPNGIRNFWFVPNERHRSNDNERHLVTMEEPFRSCLHPQDQLIEYGQSRFAFITENQGNAYRDYVRMIVYAMEGFFIVDSFGNEYKVKSYEKLKQDAIEIARELNIEDYPEGE